MKRLGVGVGVGAVLMASLYFWGDDWGGRIYQVHLPVVVQRLEPTPTPTPSRQILRPSSAAEFIDAMAVPGSIVIPDPGTYYFPVQAGVASGVELNGRGSAVVTGHGIRVQDSVAKISNLTVRGVKGDGFTVVRGRLELDGADVSDATDGLLDLYGGSMVWVTDTDFHDNVRGLLCGNWAQPNDGREYLVLRDVRFTNVRVRTPKLQDCTARAENLTVVNAVEWGIDLRGTSEMFVWGLDIVYGPKTNEPGWIAQRNSRMEVYP